MHVLCHSSPVSGRIVRADEGLGGGLKSTVQSAKWAFSVSPVLGWGDEGAKQKATAGWLAALPVFEPHWQVWHPLIYYATGVVSIEVVF